MRHKLISHDLWKAELKSIRELNGAAIREISELEDALSEADALNEKLHVENELLKAIIIKFADKDPTRILVPEWMVNDE